MNSHEDSIETLEQVSRLQSELNQVVKAIRIMKYRKLGLNQVVISEDQRQRMIHSAVTQCNQKCSKLYNEMNKDRLKSGLPALQNPYKN